VGDSNCVSVDEVKAMMDGQGAGRLRR
jgi:hypothetical protein